MRRPFRLLLLALVLFVAASLASVLLARLLPRLLVTVARMALVGVWHGDAPAVQQQVTILTASDAFLVMGALTVALMLVLLVPYFCASWMRGGRVRSGSR